MKVKNMISPKGNPIANQFIIQGVTIQLPDDTYTGAMFQSYDSNIAFIARYCGSTWKQKHIYKVYLDERFWDYSITTGKYRNQFLNETKAETQKKIDSGEYILIDLNGDKLS